MIELFYSLPLLFIALSLVVGLCVGSFLNVVIYRLPKMMEAEWQAQAAELRGETIAAAPRFNLVTPDSHCPACNHHITTLENIPVLSWLVLRARCSACGVAISARYPGVELVTGLLSALVAWRFGPTAATAAALLLTWALVALAFIDFDTTLLPDSITLPLVWIGLAFNLTGTFVPLSGAVIGAMAGYLVLWSVYWLFKLATGKEGMGYGDFKLLAALGAFLGWQMLPLIVLLSSVVGAVFGVALIILARRGREIPMPFGPYLACAGYIALLFGPELTRLYLGLL
jgi:leader peptidase (prepilin peptidase)/N-methyltransferase